MNFLVVKCPTCSQQVKWDLNNITKPFCSERCKLIDLGEWASETRSIPGESVHLDSILSTEESWD